MNFRYFKTTAALCLATVVATPASAASYLFNIDINGQTGSGTLSTVGDASAGLSLVNSLTGTFNNANIILLAPASYPFINPNDNLFNANSPYFDFNGLSFTAGGNNINISSVGGEVTACSDFEFQNCSLPEPASFSARAVAAGVPEPATWAMMLMGFGAIGVSLRRRRRTQTLLQAA